MSEVFALIGGAGAGVAGYRATGDAAVGVGLSVTFVSLCAYLDLRFR